MLRTKFEERAKQMSTADTELSKLKASWCGGGNPSGGPKDTAVKGSRWMIDEWRLTIAENGKEFGEIRHPKNKSNERPYCFFENGHYN